MYDEAMVKRILERAIELDAVRSTSMTRSELLHVATELGISQATLDRAIEESRIQTGGPVKRVAIPIRPLGLLVWTSALGMVSSLLVGSGIHTLAGGGHVPFGISAGAALLHGSLIMLSGALAVLPGIKSLRPYLERNVAVWLGAAFGATVTMEALSWFAGLNVSVQSIWTYGVGLITTSIAGCCIAAFRSAPEKADADSSSRGDTGATGLSIRDRAIRIVRKWLDRVPNVPPVLRGLVNQRSAANSNC